MARTEMMRTQHSEIADLIGQIEAKMSADVLVNEGDGVRTLLSQLSGKVSVHLAMEDKALYPVMIDSGNDEACKMAESFMAEMGSLGGVFKEFVAKWPIGQVIKDDPTSFISEAQTVFKALKDRVQREESQLYPLADTI